VTYAKPARTGGQRHFAFGEYPQRKEANLKAFFTALLAGLALSAAYWVAQGEWFTVLVAALIALVVRAPLDYIVGRAQDGGKDDDNAKRRVSDNGQV
jgi:hypothetical protein